MNVPMGEIREVWRHLPRKDWASVRDGIEHAGGKYGVSEEVSHELVNAVDALEGEHRRFPDSPEQLERMLQGPLEDKVVTSAGGITGGGGIAGGTTRGGY